MWFIIVWSEFFYFEKVLKFRWSNNKLVVIVVYEIKIYIINVILMGVWGN